MSTGNNLPPEIIEAILPYLPAKPLGRFKTVSKPWCSLISDPQFARAQLQLNSHHKTSKMILVSNSECVYLLDINDLIPHLDSDDISTTGSELSFQPPSIKWREILGSCNGLVLAMDEDHMLYLMNPTTRKISKLPDSPFILFPDGDSFDVYGFGYDSSSDDYKVISFSFFTDMSITIYSLSKNSWKKLCNSPYNDLIGNLVSGVLINGSLHWLVTAEHNYSSTIIAFSIANEEFTEIELPNSIDKDTAYVYSELVVFGGKLGVFCNDLWVMEEYGVSESWTKVSIMDLLKPICSEDNNNGVIILRDEDGVVIYNVVERVRRHVSIVGGPARFAFSSGTYVESLISP